ncbi:cysteine proteinase inhibitor A-like [Zingiber officinale]|uniref:cysteine proteinase inhibitor A-like n=1 Tax=Zingiber officinale TaxID=94328 RepID=UPI001C4D269B|nr:cysteine proteinase inhibitor A-like [Zingiber officinale]
MPYELSLDISSSPRGFSLRTIAFPFFESLGGELSAIEGLTRSEQREDAHDHHGTVVGNVRESEGRENSTEIQELARFAVDEHNKKQNALLEFARVVKAREQVVARTLHHLTVEAVVGGEKKLYEPKVWVKTWLNFKQVEEFKHVGEQGKSGVNS